LTKTGRLEKRTSFDVGNVPILLQKSAIGAVWRAIDWFLGCRLPIAPFGAIALTLWRRHRLRPARGDCWWWSDGQLGEPA